MRLRGGHDHAIRRRAAHSADRCRHGAGPAKRADAHARPPRRDPARRLGRPGAAGAGRRAKAARGGGEDGRQCGVRGARRGASGPRAQADRGRDPLPMRFFLLGLAFLAAAASAQGPQTAPPADVAWPRETKAPDGTLITVYQPQVERWADNNLSGRAAVSVLAPGAKEPGFGVIELSARPEIDKSSDLVTLS